MTFVLKLWNGQWLNTFGVILSVLGVLYTGCTYLDKERFVFKAITHGQAIGILVAIFFTLSSLISVASGYVIHALFVFVLHLNIVLPPPDFSENFSIMIPGGLIMGAILGVLYSLLGERRKVKQGDNVEQIEGEEKRAKYVFAEHLFLLGGIGFVLMLGSSIGIVAWTLSPALFLPHQDVYSIILFSAGNIGGCLSGIAIVAARKSPWKMAMIFFVLFVLFFLLFLLFTLIGSPLFENVLEGILHNSQLGMFIGATISLRPDPEPKPKRGASENFVFWLVFCGMLIPFFCLGLLGINETDSPFVFFILHYFLLLGIVNSRGDQILQRINLKWHEKEEKAYFDVSGKRFALGLLIGLLYVFPAVLFLFVTDVFLGKAGGIIIYDLSQNINFSILVGLCIGFAHGVGPYIVSRIENMDDRRLGQLGIIITELGILIVLIPH